MSRNLTPRPVRATGAKDAHGSIFAPDAGALYVHMHRESGLAHRHYVLKDWQVRGLAVLLSRPMLLLYILAIVTWGWTASQAARVPMLRSRVAELTREAERLDTLTATLTELQSRYDQVQRLMAASKVQPAADTVRSRSASKAAAASPTRPDTTRRPAAEPPR